MRFGVFLAPYHVNMRQNPIFNVEDDLRLATWLDELGYDEVWFGEHHSAGSELYPSPELMIAFAAGRTRTIKLGTAAISVPYHHPFNTAGRIVFLDNMTRGRSLFGFGPGSLASDIHMHGVDAADIRRMLDEGLEAIVRLVTEEEPISIETDWFRMRDAFLQIRPYSQPMKMAVTAAVTPSGPMLAAKHGLSILSMAATVLEGFDMLSAHWRVYEDRCRDGGKAADRDTWRMVGPMHIARTREQAYADMAYGLEDWVNYMLTLGAFPMPKDVVSARHDYRRLCDAANECGFAVIGTPDDACRQIERLVDQSGGFGTYLLTGHDWADVEATNRSYELFARFVFPVFQNTARARAASYDWFLDNRDMLTSGPKQATQTAMRSYAEHHPEYNSVMETANEAMTKFRRSVAESEAPAAAKPAPKSK
jgi:limonene 1,2-monooxygenase